MYTEGDFVCGCLGCKVNKFKMVAGRSILRKRPRIMNYRPLHFVKNHYAEVCYKLQFSIVLNNF